MSRRIAMGLVGGVLGYVLGAFGGGYLIGVLSSNTHDRSVEAAMTGAFVLGPVMAIVGTAIGFWRSKGSTSTKGVA